MRGILRFNLIFLQAFILYSVPYFAQVKSIRLDHLTIEQGLSQSSVNCIAQDSTGFLWIGTQDGLDRYDGYSFVVYKPVPNDVSSISDNYIGCLLVDKFGNLWIGTDNGLNKYNSATDTFIPFKNIAGDTGSISSNYINSISEDKNGNLWIGTYRGLNFFDKSKNKFIRYLHNKKNKSSLLSDTVYSTFVDSKNRLWVGTAKGLDLFYSGTKTFRHIVDDQKGKKSIAGHGINSIAEDQSGNLWIGTYHGLDRLNMNSNTFTHFAHSNSNHESISSDSINVIYVDRNGKVWIGTDSGGLDSFNPATGIFTNFENSVVNYPDANDKQILSLLEDSEGLLWIGTFTSGVYKYDKSERSFGFFKIIDNKVNNKEINDISAIFKDHHNNLWIGTFNAGLIKLNEKTGKYVQYIHTSSPSSISQNFINVIFEDQHGSIWVGTTAGLDKFNPASNTFSHFKHNTKDINSPADNFINTIASDKSGNLWLGFAGGGMDKFNPSSNKFIHFKHEPGNVNTLSNNEVNFLFFDNSGILWIGTNGSGLDRFDITTGKFRHYVHRQKNSNSLCNNSIFDIFQFRGDTTGTIWIGTSGGGFSRLNTKTDQFKNYSEVNGLANNEVYGILGDEKGNLWMSTNGGISKFNTKEETFCNYDQGDGLQSNEFNQGPFFKDKHGKMYFGGINGIDAFFPDSIKHNPYNPQVVFTSFKDYDKPNILKSSIWKTNQIKLSYKDNIVSFRFASLSYNDPIENKFAYMLKGLNNKWIENETNNEVTFTNLPPGKYSLLVKGTNNDGIWSSHIASINIFVLPPFWQAWWFRIIAVVFIAALIFLYLKLRLRTIQLRNKKLEIVVSDRTKELNSKKEELEKVNYKQAELLDKITKSEMELKGLNQHKDKIISVLAHDLRSPFNGLLGYTELLANEIDQLETEDIRQSAKNIHSAANNLFKLLNNLLEWALVQAGRIKYSPSNENLLQSVNEIIQLLKVNAEQKSNSLKSSIESDINVWADKNMLDIILRNLVSNAVKFTPAGGNIEIFAKRFDSEVEILIRDNGVGMEEEILARLLKPDSRISTKGTNNESGTGLGLNLCKELIVKQGGKIRIESKAGAGTLVAFTLPESKAN